MNKKLKIKKGDTVIVITGKDKGKTGEILDLASKDGIVEKSGAWYSYNGDRIGQGRENAKTFLKENPEIASQIEDSIRASSQKEFVAEEENQDSVLEETQTTE